MACVKYISLAMCQVMALHSHVDSAKWHMQVATNVAGFTQHLGSQAMNAGYYMEQIDELKHKLQEPIAVRLLLSFSRCQLGMPCLHSSCCHVHSRTSLAGVPGMWVQ